ncbi:NAD(P) transhydrogenase subunit alpha [Saccharospirillum sp. MSK14-1]|uniref:Re/Si-specific NAD(P)(+) transhydrogenase subunit alpha n=1 Tax=Saccharospirillum sp. MSK14-1 TaxID=1897632 RepID=UPI000D408243|nr:Re/Si-specific NAD(P)(+) transhydrogenase subunit alpha [Saccharospirillum sp. MSK14-1]PTY37250.1 NAD(P) transhydrogenase subunit alpha [Saccharospirillum sp. MSK14-1]
MTIAVPRDRLPGETRIAVTPDTTRKLIELGFTVRIESDAGAAAQFSDERYAEAGADITDDVAALYDQADVLVKINGPQPQHPALNGSELDALGNNKTWISFLAPAQNETTLNTFADRGANAVSLDAIPRISRAQKMDVLSSMANIAGYRAVIEAANQFGRFFTGQITAAGKIPPAKVLIIGAGVAGLAAIGAAKSLGAVVRAFDTRKEVKEQVESMGGQFLTVELEEDGSGSGGYAKEMSQAFIDAEMALFMEQAKEVDIIITTALIPGKPAPKLITEEMVKAMAPGSVVVDLAAPNGGNCECTLTDEIVEQHDVKIIGFTNLAARAATQASQLLSNNVLRLFEHLCPNKDGELTFDLEDDITRGCTVVHQGKVIWPAPPPQISAVPKAEPKTTEPTPETTTATKRAQPIALYWLIAGALLLGLGAVAPADFIGHFTVFVLAVFVGWQVIWNVSHSLHTPLMSVTNAISSIIIIGSLLQVSGSGSTLVTVLAAIGILVTSINIAGGFYVTRRMLNMFRREGQE